MGRIISEVVRDTTAQIIDKVARAGSIEDYRGAWALARETCRTQQARPNGGACFGFRDGSALIFTADSFYPTW